MVIWEGLLYTVPQQESGPGERDVEEGEETNTNMRHKIHFFLYCR